MAADSEAHAGSGAMYSSPAGKRKVFALNFALEHECQRNHHIVAAHIRDALGTKYRLHITRTRYMLRAAKNAYRYHKNEPQLGAFSKRDRRRTGYELINIINGIKVDSQDDKTEELLERLKLQRIFFRHFIRITRKPSDEEFDYVKKKYLLPLVEKLFPVEEELSQHVELMQTVSKGRQIMLKSLESREKFLKRKKEFPWSGFMEKLGTQIKLYEEYSGIGGDSVLTMAFQEIQKFRLALWKDPQRAREAAEKDWEGCFKLERNDGIDENVAPPEHKDSEEDKKEDVEAPPLPQSSSSSSSSSSSDGAHDVLQRIEPSAHSEIRPQKHNNPKKVLNFKEEPVSQRARLLRTVQRAVLLRERAEKSVKQQPLSPPQKQENKASRANPLDLTLDDNSSQDDLETPPNSPPPQENEQNENHQEEDSQDQGASDPPPGGYSKQEASSSGPNVRRRSQSQRQSTRRLPKKPRLEPQSPDVNKPTSSDDVPEVRSARKAKIEGEKQRRRKSTKTKKKKKVKRFRSPVDSTPQKKSRNSVVLSIQESSSDDSLQSSVSSEGDDEEDGDYEPDVSPNIDDDDTQDDAESGSDEMADENDDAKVKEVVGKVVEKEKDVQGGLVQPRRGRGYGTTYPGKRYKWTEAEDDTLEAGIKKYGFGNWKAIFNDDDFRVNFHTTRTAPKLKDRARTRRWTHENNPEVGDSDDDESS